MACISSLILNIDCTPWNKHLFEINEALNSLHIPIEVDVYNHLNALVALSVIDGVKKALFLSNQIWIESWEHDHKDMMREAIASGSKRAIFKTDEAIIYVDEFNYFYIGNEVKYMVKDKLTLSEGMNLITSVISE